MTAPFQRANVLLLASLSFAHTHMCYKRLGTASTTAIVLLFFFIASGCDSAASSQPPLSATIATTRPDVPLHSVAVEITNSGQSPVTIAKPSPGSFYCKAMPHYKFTVRDADGREVPLDTPYEPFDEEVRPAITGFVTLEPDQKYEFECELPHALPARGYYTVEFKYLFKDNNNAEDATSTLWEGAFSAVPVRLELGGEMRVVVDEQGIGSVKDLHQYSDIDASGSNLTNADLVQLIRRSGGAARLRRLNLRRTRVTNDGLALIGSLERLRVLDVSHTRINDEGLQHLVSLKNLEVLDLSNTDISDGGLRAVQALPAIKELDLFGTGIGDDGAQFISSVPTLEVLSLAHTKLTDNGLQYLSRMPRLRILFAYGTRISADGLRSLILPEVLRHLSVDREDVTDEVREILSRERPALRVFVTPDN